MTGGDPSGCEPIPPAGLALPRGACWAESSTPLDDPLFDVERAYLAPMVAKRRREFTTARACARRALAPLGQERTPMVPGLKGAPTWPVGVVGSMTHTDTYAAAVVARHDDVAAIGIDAEPHAALPDGVREVIATRDELAQLAGLARAQPGVAWDRLLFSAKESVYKAWFPHWRRWLEFTDVRVALSADGTFAATLLAGTRPEIDFVSALRGRWILRDVTPGGLLVAVAVRLP